MRAALIFGDESDTVSPKERDVFVYAFLGLSFSTYERLQAEFWDLKRALRVAAEVKWTRTVPHRAAFLELVARHPVEVQYYVADKRRLGAARPDRYRYKVLEAAFSSLFPLELHEMPLVLLDERNEQQNREEAVILRALGAKWRCPLPPHSYLPSDRVVGLQLVDMIVGALRAFESRGDATWQVIRDRTRRFEI